jgi:hypothetical protein
MIKYILCCRQTLHINLLKKFFENFGHAHPAVYKMQRLFKSLKNK